MFFSREFDDVINVFIMLPNEKLKEIQLYYDLDNVNIYYEKNNQTHICFVSECICCATLEKPMFFIKQLSEKENNLKNDMKNNIDRKMVKL